jgi:hypothetical protein
MRKLACLSFLFLLPAQAQRPWQEVTVPSIREVAANFKTPPHEYGAIQPFASWNGPDARERIVRDLDRLAANGIFVVNVSPGRGEPKYLTPAHMDQMKFTVAEAAKRGIKIWLQDESDYPSGFAGGKIRELYPRLGMQGIVADIRVRVVPGQTLTLPLPPDTLGIFATKTSPDGTLQGVVPIPAPANGQLQWIVPREGSTPNEPRLSWEVVFVRHVYISSPTRNFNREDGTRAKDSLYTLIDYLDANATRAFLKITHQTYFDALGPEFGKTILGFFGDEPDYSIPGYPWTPGLLETFKQKKGYDLLPYIPQFFEGKLSDEAQRAKADYYDVWSGIFQNTFFKTQADWCSEHRVEYLVHLNHEETMTALVRSEGDYFRDNRYVQVPGVDNLSQLVPGLIHAPDGAWRINNNFPKLASSAAHLFGHPQVWAEEGGSAGISGKFELDFQLVRGVNALQIRVPVMRGPGGPESTAPPSEVPPQASLLAWYTNRAGYLTAIGRPAAQVGLYHPVSSLWMGDTDADASTTKLGWQLLEHQVDWDYFDEQSLESVAKIEDGGFRNLSGQLYRAIIVPSATVISRKGIERFREFVKAGGKVIFVGRTPSFVVDKTFLSMKEKPDLSFATLIEESGDITPRVIAALPKPDVNLDAPFPRLTYAHRSWRDAEMYLFFNESDKAESRLVTIAGRGQAQIWDLGTGEIHPASGASASTDSVSMPLVLGPYQTKVIVLGPLPDGAGSPEPSLTSATTLAEIVGAWAIGANHKQFTLGAVPAGKRIFLEFADVHDCARVTINGKQLAARGWQPYRWELTGLAHPGANDLDVEVSAMPAGRGVGGRAAPAPIPPGVFGSVRIVAR